MSKFVIGSTIDSSEPVNPVLRVTVNGPSGTRTYSMSLQSVDPEKHEWCQHVISENVANIVTQVEADTKNNIKNSIVNTMEEIGIKL